MRSSAAMSLGMFGSDAESSLPAPRKLQLDSDPQVKSAADWAVEQIQEGLKKK